MRPILRHALAAAAIAIVVAIKLALVPHVEQDTPFLLFFAALLVVSWFSGLSAGIFATLLAAVSSAFFFMKPYWDIRVEEPAVRFRLAMFIGEGLFICGLVSIANKSRRRADAAVAQARELESRILEASEHARRQVGHELHDGLGQHLAGAAFRVSALTRRLNDSHDPQVRQDAVEIEQLLSRAVAWTRELADGMSPVRMRADGLAAALEELASDARESAGISCDFRASRTHVDSLNAISAAAAVQLLQVAREAVQDAVDHAQAKRVTIDLSPSDGRDALVLTIRSDGKHNGDDAANGKAAVMQSMACRARLIHARVDWRRTETNETEMICTCPLDRPRNSEEG